MTQIERFAAEIDHGAIERKLVDAEQTGGAFQHGAGNLGEIQIDVRDLKIADLQLARGAATDLFEAISAKIIREPLRRDENSGGRAELLWMNVNEEPVSTMSRADLPFTALGNVVTATPDATHRNTREAVIGEKPGELFACGAVRPIAAMNRS